MSERKFYVYLHLIPNTTEVVYVGKGTGQRAWSVGDRGKEHKAAGLLHNGFRVKIVKKNLTSSEALKFEAALIERLKPKFNKSKTGVVKDIIYEEWSELVYYDETSPTFLRWKIDTGWNGLYFLAKKDAPAGCKGRYNTLMFKRKSYRVSRIIWVLFNKSVSKDKIIDHIDGNTLNDNISNLREITTEINTRNRKLNIRGSTGIHGVYLKNSKRDGPTMIATCQDLSGRKIRVGFSVNKYGYETALQLAIDKRKEMIKILNENGAGYTQRHLNG